MGRGGALQGGGGRWLPSEQGRASAAPLAPPALHSHTLPLPPQKCATTSLYFHLRRHPQMLIAHTKVSDGEGGGGCCALRA